MLLIRSILTALFLKLTGDTLIVADIAEMAWPGQFNLGFLMYLVLSALWIVWRHAFSLAAIEPARSSAVQRPVQ